MHYSVMMKYSNLITMLLIHALNMSYAKREVFLNQRIVEIHGGEEKAQSVARDLGFIYLGQEKQSDNKRDIDTSLAIPHNKRFPTIPIGEDFLTTYSGVTKHGDCFSSLYSPYIDAFNDPLWGAQWYIHDYRKENSPVMSHNVFPVYEMGITGKNVKVMIVDDGIEFNHPDLKPNLLKNLSYNSCTRLENFNLMPKKDSHGTRCAGIIGMVANNKICGVGIAYNAYIAGANIDCPLASCFIEAKALNHHLAEVDIYSSSWGPDDDGITMYKLGWLQSQAISKGISQGRDGKGAIYVFTAGNGKQVGDNCAADDTNNYIGTISIASVSQSGKPAQYSERCTAVFAATYSGDRIQQESIVAPSDSGACETDFSGTSASTAVASGIFALVLQANPKLTYRDIMHLIAMTSEVAPLADNGNTWYKNGHGFWVSNDFGFGLLNAENMVIMAKNWIKVPEKYICTIILKPKSSDAMNFETNKYIEMHMTTDSCKTNGKDIIRYLEEIELTSTVKYAYRGALKISITSPAGTTSILLEPRPRDKNTYGLNGWTIKSVHNWGEDPRGDWIVRVEAVKLRRAKEYVGVVKKFTLTLHGTYEKPAHYKMHRIYSAFRLPNGQTPWTK